MPVEYRVSRLARSRRPTAVVRSGALMSDSTSLSVRCDAGRRYPASATAVDPLPNPSDGRSPGLRCRLLATLGTCVLGILPGAATLASCQRGGSIADHPGRRVCDGEFSPVCAVVTLTRCPRSHSRCEGCARTALMRCAVSEMRGQPSVAASCRKPAMTSRHR
jgi:hypothetical protein